MTRVIKVNCDKLYTIIGFSIWFAITASLGFAIYVQVVTLDSFTESGNDECHWAYFDGKKLCESDVNTPWYIAEYGAHTPPLNKHDIMNYFYGYIVFEIAIQIIVFLILNAANEWIKIECTSEKSKGDVTNNE